MKPDDAAALPPPGARPARVLRWRGGRRSEADDWLSEELPVALEFNGVSHAVMLATPVDLEDFALGFSLSEGLIDSRADLYDCEVSTAPEGVTLRLQVASRCFERLKDRRRTLAGRTGCGLCGTESLSQVLRPLPALPPVPGEAPLAAARIAAGVRAMRDAQRLCRVTGSAHAAAWCDAEGRVRLLREDVGRHNALDKLVGALAAAHLDPAAGFIAVTSRASVEMVQKAVVAGARRLAAVSAPTQLAVATADGAGLTLLGLVRDDDLVIYSHAARVRLADEEH